MNPGSTDIRTLIATSLPRAAVGHGVPLIASDADDFLQAALTSYALDFVLRQKLGGTNLTFNYMQQLPIPPPAVVNRESVWASGPIREWIGRRVRHLNDGAPLSVRRQLLAELNAAFFHLYGLMRDDVGYIMESFPIVKRTDIMNFGDYRTMLETVEAYDAISESAQSGVPYVSRLGQDSGRSVT